MNAPSPIRILTDIEAVPACLLRAEPQALYMWTSSKRLVVVKDESTVSLDADDIRALVRFCNASHVEDQL